MKPAVTAVLIVVIGLLGGGCGDDTRSKPAGDRASGGFKKLQACDLLTLDDAKKIIGPDAEKWEGGTNIDSATNHISLSLCQFQSADGKHYISLLVRAPLSEAGAAGNESGFDPSRPAGAQDVSGYGDRAYYDSSSAQLFVLDHRVYLTFMNTRGAGGGKPSVADMQKVADLVLPRLS